MSFFRSYRMLLARLVFIATAAIFCFWPAISMVRKDAGPAKVWHAFFELNRTDIDMYFGICHKGADEVGLELSQQIIDLVDKLEERLPEEMEPWGPVELEFVSLLDRKVDGCVDWSEKEKNVLTFYYDKVVENGVSRKIICDLTFSIAAIYNSRVFPVSMPASYYSSEDLAAMVFVKETTALLEGSRNNLAQAAKEALAEEDRYSLPGRGRLETISIASYTGPYLVMKDWAGQVLATKNEYLQKQLDSCTDPMSAAVWGEKLIALGDFTNALVQRNIPKGESSFLAYIHNVDPEEDRAIQNLNRKEIRHFWLLMVVGFCLLVLGVAPRISFAFVSWPIRFYLRRRKKQQEEMARRAVVLFRVREAEKLRLQKLAVEQAEWEEIRRRRAEREAEWAATPKPVQVDDTPIPSCRSAVVEPVEETSRQKTERLKRQIEERYPEFGGYEELWPKLTSRNIQALDEFTEANEGNRQALAEMFATLTEHRVPSHVLDSARLAAR